MKISALIRELETRKRDLGDGPVVIEIERDSRTYENIASIVTNNSTKCVVLSIVGERKIDVCKECGHVNYPSHTCRPIL